VNREAEERPAEVGAAATFLHEGVLPVACWIVLGALCLPLVSGWQQGSPGTPNRPMSAGLTAGLAVVLTGLARTVVRLWLLRLVGRRTRAVVVSRSEDGGPGWVVAFRDEFRRSWRVPLRTPAPTSWATGDAVAVTYERSFPPNVTTRSPGGLGEAAVLTGLTLTLAMFAAVDLRIGVALFVPG
jgi:hypothetical protein